MACALSPMTLCKVFCIFPFSYWKTKKEQEESLVVQGNFVKKPKGRRLEFLFLLLT